MSTPTKLRLKRILRYSLMPNGYRLATVKEVGNNLEEIKRRKLLQVEKIESALLLEGHISSDYRVNTTCRWCFWRLVVKEKVWDEETGGWKKKCSACYPSSGNLLRAQLYDEIILSEQERKNALCLATINADAEVICWLLKTTNSETEFRGFQHLFSLNEMKKWGFYEMYNLVKCLCSSKFPLQLPLEEDDRGKTVLDYLISFIESCRLPFWAIQWIELLIEFYSTNIVHHDKIRDGVSFLDKATSKAIVASMSEGLKYKDSWIAAFTKLLSVSSNSVENQVSKIKHCFGDVLIEAVERGYAQLVDALLEFKDSNIDQLPTDVCLEVARGAIGKGYPNCLEDMLNLLKKKVGNEIQQDKYGKTLFHYAAKSENEEVSRLITGAYLEEYSVKKVDKWGRTFLHWAALTGQADLCRVCIGKLELKVDAKDNLGQNALHLAAKGIRGHLVVDILFESSAADLVYAVDGEGRTPLHSASAKGNMAMVKKLLSRSLQQPQGLENTATNLSRLKTFLEQRDGFGMTALQMAAKGGHIRIVQRLLEEDIDPFLQRDVHGRTALHYATGVQDSDVALAISQSLVNKYEKTDDNRSLMLWASAAGIGTAEERERVNPLVKDYLLQEKARDNKNLLKAAAKTRNVEMVWELLNRGADIKQLKEEYSNNPYRYEEFNKVIKEIQIANEQGQDKPTSEDNLGRNVFAEGLAALFLNKFVESPITVGVCGEWGMGKSSLMVQTENILLMAASQLSFPNLLPFEDFGGAKKLSLSTKGRKICRRMKNAAYKLFPDNSTSAIYKRMKNAMSKLLPFTRTGNRLIKLLEEYHPEYHAIYKSLACMDVHNQMLKSDADENNQFQPMREAPRILTIRYNAWHYRDEHEAWAGLAVTITKEIEQVMTRAQKFNTWWRYSWAKNGVNIYIQIFLPCVLAIFLAGWVAWGAWPLLREAKFKDLKYGSIPFTIIAIVWGVLKSIISVVKPVSIEMMGYINSPDHTARLGYQQQVISDINFLKGELGKKPHWFFSFIAGEWCWNWFGLYPDNVENTRVPKFSPASEDQLRMIAFVDDLDRCDEKVIIQVLSAINLVLAECKINVILGIDKKMIQKAVERHFEDNEDRDLADKFICKIIQIPLSLPDLIAEETDEFLEHYLGQPPPTRTAIRVEDGEGTDYGEIDTDNDDIEIHDECPRQESTSVDIKPYNRPPTSCPGIVKKVFSQLTCFLQNLCLIACNLSSELRQMQDVVNKKEIRPLTFSKGARLTREMLLSKYNLEEAKTLYKLKEFVTGSQNLPREWKRFLDYYKFACNILSMIGKVYKLPSWRVELVAWTFICWQWKHEMNTLIKGWHKYADVKSKDKYKLKQIESEYQDEDVEVEGQVKEDRFAPSLKQIVMHYVIELHELPKKSDTEVHLDKDKRRVETQEGLAKLKKCSRQDPFVKAVFFTYGHDTTTFEESQDQYSSWLNLLKALHDVQDVSMKGIQLFQQFRFHCEIDNLPWPLPESNDTTYKRLTEEMQMKKDYH